MKALSDPVVKGPLIRYCKVRLIISQLKPWYHRSLTLPPPKNFSIHPIYNFRFRFSDMDTEIHRFYLHDIPKLRHIPCSNHSYPHLGNKWTEPFQLFTRFIVHSVTIIDLYCKSTVGEVINHCGKQGIRRWWIDITGWDTRSCAVVNVRVVWSHQPWCSCS